MKHSLLWAPTAFITYKEAADFLKTEVLQVIALHDLFNSQLVVSEMPLGEFPNQFASTVLRIWRPELYTAPLRGHAILLQEPYTWKRDD